MKRQKGGIETILATIILAGLVIALIIAVVLPMVQETSDLGASGKTRISDLKGSIAKDE